ncbi:hypothetical protein [Kamptonema formosum]|uniref:hypothetical protein n=1 Tax=Kamptonema formosum TaxID=331992 RepID=UPI001E4957FA|nr:hypothetical protein [Oscillatoria sp. PCC 10802]
MKIYFPSMFPATPVLSHPTALAGCAAGDKIAGIKAQNSNPPRHSPQMDSQPDIMEPAVARFRRARPACESTCGTARSAPSAFSK